MKIAWVTPYVPAPPTKGGAIRQHRLAAALASCAEVHLFARGELWESAQLWGAARGPFATTWVGRDYWPLPPARTRSIRVRRGSPASLYRAVADLHRRVSLDLVVVSHSWASLGAADLGLPWLLDEHNVESRYFEELYRAENRSGERVERELSEIARWERSAWTSCTALSCVSEKEANFMAPHCGAEEGPVVVENGATLLPAMKQVRQRRSGGVVFVGSMRHAPNVEAARRLAERILPRVRAERPEVELTIVGGPIPAALAPSHERSNDNGANVHFTGVVPDVRPYLAQARVFANPLSHGAGSSLKIVEALAAGLPIVSSEVGARGFGLEPGRHYLLANTDEEQARAIVRILSDPDLANGLSEAAREQAERYDWTRLGDRFVELALRAAHA
jgi:glycosyltransferase involved in cell wall biosynthesis